jgi:predicted tellurium resistance membrane protein TerC
VLNAHNPPPCNTQTTHSLDNKKQNQKKQKKTNKQSVALVLAFIGTKMLVEFAGVEVRTDASLLVVAALLGGGVAGSLLLPAPKEDEKEKEGKGGK